MIKDEESIFALLIYTPGNVLGPSPASTGGDKHPRVGHEGECYCPGGRLCCGKPQQEQNKS